MFFFSILHYIEHDSPLAFRGRSKPEKNLHKFAQILKLRTATGIKYSPTFDYELTYSIKNLRKRLFGLKFDFVNFEEKKQRVFP